MLPLVLLSWQIISTAGVFFNYYGNDWYTYYPGQMVLNTVGYYEKRFPSTAAQTEILDHFPGFYRPTKKKQLKMMILNETKNFDRYMKTYFETQNGIQAEVLRYKFTSLESHMESAENKSSVLMKRWKQLETLGGGEIEDFWFLQYQKRSLRKLMRAYNTSQLLPYSKMFVPGAKLPWNSSNWIKSFDEIFEELKEGEPLVAPDLFEKQKTWWIQNRKKICLFKIDALRNYIKTVDNFFYQNRAVLSVARWIKDRELLYSRKLSDLFWWLCRRDQYYREEYARLDYERLWTPWASTRAPPGAQTTYDYFRYNGDFHYLLRRRNKFYAKFFKRKKIGLFIKRLQQFTTLPSTHHQIYGILFDEFRTMKNFPSDTDNMELAVAPSQSKKMFCFQYFGKVLNVGLRSAIYNRIRDMYSGQIRGYIMYTHRGTVFGKICGVSTAVDEMKDYLKKLKTPTSKVTKLEFRGESDMQRYPKGLKKFHFYRGLFERGPHNVERIMSEYNRMQLEDRLLDEATEDDVSNSVHHVTDPIDHQVNALFKKYADGMDPDNNRARIRYNLRAEGIYDTH